MVHLHNMAVNLQSQMQNSPCFECCPVRRVTVGRFRVDGKYQISLTKVADHHQNLKAHKKVDIDFSFILNDLQCSIFDPGFESLCYVRRVSNFA